ncbi:MAG: TetR/AcrR family transcriptional regulator [Pseudomonadota bacterium]
MSPKSAIRHDQQKAKEPAAETLTRQRIIAGARHHFFAYGFRQVTMDDLARELGMSKRTLYMHFSSKTALMQAVLNHKFSEIEADLERITHSSCSDFPVALRQLLECMQRHTGEIQPPFVRDVRRDAPELFKVAERRRREIIHTYYGTLLNEGCRAGIIRTDIPAKLIIEILLVAVEAILNPQRLDDLGLTLKAGFSAVITVILEGVITEQGRSHL